MIHGSTSYKASSAAWQNCNFIFVGQSAYGGVKSALPKDFHLLGL
jgi:hypothetical protein